LPRLDHVAIKALDQEAMRDFLIDVLGVHEGPRPPFDFHGYWLYFDDVAVIHLFGERRMHAVHGQRVLRQVVGADRGAGGGEGRAAVPVRMAREIAADLVISVLMD